MPEKIVQQYTFENGFGPIRFTYKCRDDQFTIQNDPAGGTNKVIRIIADGNQKCREPGGEMKSRNFFYTDGVNRTYQSGYVYTISAKVFIKDMHPKGGSCVAGSFSKRGGGDVIGSTPQIYWCNQEFKLRNPVDNYSNKDTMTLKRVPVPFNRWFTLAQEYKHGNPDGYYKVYIDGELVLDHQGHVGSPAYGSKVYQPRFGFYYGPEMRDGSYEMYFDDITVGDGACK
jgi:hypothetical protein